MLANNRGRASFYGEVDPPRIELLEDAVDRMGPDDPVTRARVLSLLALELTFDAGLERRRGLSDTALELARACGDDRALGQVLRDRLYTIWAPGTVEERRANVAELLELSQRLDDPVLSYWARVSVMDVRSEVGTSRVPERRSICARRSPSKSATPHSVGRLRRRRVASPP